MGVCVCVWSVECRERETHTIRYLVFKPYIYSASPQRSVWVGVWVCVCVYSTH